MKPILKELNEARRRRNNLTKSRIQGWYGQQKESLANNPNVHNKLRNASKFFDV